MKKIYKPILAFLLLLIVVLFSASEIKAQHILNNNLLRAGNGTEQSINATGNLQQPWYYNLTQWYKLTYSNYALDNNFALGGDGTNEWNLNGTNSFNTSMSGQVIDASGFTFTSGNNGYGTIISTGNVTINGQLMEVQHTYFLPQSIGYIKVTTRVKNVSGTPMGNIRYWIGTRDDWVGNSDVVRKQKGNLISNAFVQNTLASDKALALKLSTGSEAVLFYTASNKANMITYPSYSGFINNVVPQNPATSSVDYTSDGAYGMFVRFNDLAVNESDEIIWYYAAGALADIEEIIAQVASASGAVNNIACTTATFNATSSASGTGYYVVVPQGSTTPTAAQIKNGGNYGAVTVVTSGSASVTANSPHAFSLTGLSNGTNYDVYFVSEDGVPAFSAVASANFTTLTPASFSVCPGNISQTSPDNNGMAVTYSSTAAGSSPTVTYAFTGATTGSGSGNGSGSTFNIGITTVTLTVTNACGSTTCVFTVTVNPHCSDNVNPTITCPASVAAFSITNAGTVVYFHALAHDNLPGVTVTYNHNPGTVFPIGVTNVTATATDACGNTATCSFDVTVTLCAD